MKISAKQNNGLEAVRELFRLRLLVLYGSRATGGAGEQSDFDLAFLGQEVLPFGVRYELQQALGRVLAASAEKVDLVDLRSAPPLLLYYIVRDGIRLAGSEREFDALYRRAIKRYIDAKPLLAATADYVRSYVDRYTTGSAKS